MCFIVKAHVCAIISIDIHSGGCETLARTSNIIGIGKRSTPLLAIMECFKFASGFLNIVNAVKDVFLEVVGIARIVVFRPSGRLSNSCGSPQPSLLEYEQPWSFLRRECDFCVQLTYLWGQIRSGQTQEERAQLLCFGHGKQGK